MSTRQVVVVGAGGHAVSVAESVLAAGYELVAFTSIDLSTPVLLGRPVLPEVPEDHVDSGGLVVVAVGDNASRERVWGVVSARVPFGQLPSLVHPSASVSALASVGPGTVILQGSVVGSAARVGAACLLNSGSILEHEGTMADFSSLAPGAVTGGRVTIGRGSAIGIGAVVRHGVSIGRDTVIGSASYVHEDVPPGVVAYGTPARVVRQRRHGDPYLG